VPADRGDPDPADSRTCHAVPGTDEIAALFARWPSLACRPQAAVFCSTTNRYADINLRTKQAR